VALKRLHRQLVRTESALVRLRRELDALSQLNHPNIVPVRDVVAWDGVPTIVMDYVDGEDLAERVRRHGKLPHDEVAKLARALLEALAATHDVGIVHRDVKPQNVRIAKSGRAMLLDFGSARLDASSKLTATGVLVGTPAYMAPELFSAPAYDPRVDLYAVGVTLFEALSGSTPLSADTLAELAFVRANGVCPRVREVVPDCPEALALVIDRCLQKVPELWRPSTTPEQSWLAWLADLRFHPVCTATLPCRRTPGSVRLVSGVRRFGTTSAT
jgi:eukaryotic-like serine/threonine-protein kinase